MATTLQNKIQAQEVKNQKLPVSATTTSGETYSYMAWSEQPFVSSKGVPCTAR